VKHEPPRGSGGMPPRKFLKMHALRLNLVLSEAQNFYAKDIQALEVCCEKNFIGSIIVHANLSSWELRFKQSDSCATLVIFASCLPPQFHKPIKQSLFSFSYRTSASIITTTMCTHVVAGTTKLYFACIL